MDATHERVKLTDFGMANLMTDQLLEVCNCTKGCVRTPGVGVNHVCHINSFSCSHPECCCRLFMRAFFKKKLQPRYLHVHERFVEVFPSLFCLPSRGPKWRPNLVRPICAHVHACVRACSGNTSSTLCLVLHPPLLLSSPLPHHPVAWGRRKDFPPLG